MPYPTLPQLSDSTQDRQDGLDVERASNGLLKSRRLWSTEESTFLVRHILTSAERTTLEAHYSANKNNSDTFVWRMTGETFTVRYAAAPQYKRVGRHFEATVKLMEV